MQIVIQILFVAFNMVCFYNFFEFSSVYVFVYALIMIKKESFLFIDNNVRSDGFSTGIVDIY